MNSFIMAMRSIETVFSKVNYVLLAILVAVIFYLLQAIIVNFSNIINITGNYDIMTTLNLIGIILVAFWGTVEFSSFISIAVISLLTGTLVSLLVYRIKHLEFAGKKHGLLGSIGIFLGMFVPGCAACGIGLISLVGLGTAVASLPFQGLELSILVILILVYVNYQTAVTLFTCKSLNTERSRKRVGKK